MKAVALLVVLLGLCALALSQTPSTPVWPSQFSASVQFESNNPRFPFATFFRWFYSLSAQTDRVDGLFDFFGEMYFTNRYFFYNNNTEYVVYLREDTATCVSGTERFPIPDPSFTNYTYVGTGLVNFQPAQIWANEQPTGTATYFVKADGTPLQFTLYNNTERASYTYTFWEFDVAPQDPTIFAIPADLSAICFNV